MTTPTPDQAREALDAQAARIKELAYEMSREDVDAATTEHYVAKYKLDAAKQTAREFEAAVDELASTLRRFIDAHSAELADLKRIRVAVIAERDALRADAERYRWLVDHARSTAEHWGGRWSLVIDGPAPVRHDCADALDAAIDAARAAMNPQEPT